MSLKKSKSRNSSSRKNTELLREWLTDIVENRRGSIADDLDMVDAATRLNFIAKILPYLLPRLQSIDDRVQNQNTIILKEID